MKRHINKFGRLHSDNGPALIDDFNNKFYFQDGILHRLDGPAIEFANGDQVWYKNGLIHRDGNLPATLYNMNKSFNTWEFLNEHEKKINLISKPLTLYAKDVQQWYKHGILIAEVFNEHNLKDKKDAYLNEFSKIFFSLQCVGKIDQKSIKFLEKYLYKSKFKEANDIFTCESTEFNFTPNNPLVRITNNKLNYNVQRLISEKMVSFNPLIKRDTLDFKETYNDKGLLHSFDGNPALIDEKNIKYFFNNGKLENKDINKATIIGILRDIWIKNGFIRKIHFKPQNIVVYFDSNGKLHRKFGPAITSTNNNIPEVQAWLQNGDFYRENELPHLIVRQKTPMLYSRNSLNDIKEEDSVVSSWMTKKGQLHNLNGPAKVIELLVKKDKIEHYYINGIHLKNKNHFYLEKIKKKSNFKL